ncbi:hypothetical protein [Kitasatospora sp. NPDC001132]
MSEETPEGTTEETPETPAETPDASEAAAKIAALEAKLAEAAPILQAHADAEAARKSAEEKLREELEAAQRERDEAQRGLMLREVAEETGLASNVVALLHGASKDELLAAAKTVADQAKARPGAPARPNPTVGGGTDAKSTDSDDIDPMKLAAAIAKRVRF